jgi:hypothetical protein
MGIFFDIIFAIPIGILYNMLIHKICDTFNNELSYNDRMQKNLIIIFGGCLIAFFIAYFNKKNKSLKYGLYLGALLLFFHSVIYNWYIMYNDTKIIVMSLCFLVLIWYTYSSSNPQYTTDEFNLMDDDSTYLPAVYSNYKENMKNIKQKNSNRDDDDYDEIINFH